MSELSEEKPIVELRWDRLGEGSPRLLYQRRQGEISYTPVPDAPPFTPPEVPEVPEALDTEDVGPAQWLENHLLQQLDRMPVQGSLGLQQEKFALCFGTLLLVANVWGYRTRVGDVFRDPRAFGEVGESGPYGAPSSNHKRKLAGDVNLFQRGRWLTATEDHGPLGVWWEHMGQRAGLPLRWGGRYQDGNHYELAMGWEYEPLE